MMMDKKTMNLYARSRMENSSNRDSDVPRTEYTIIYDILGFEKVWTVIRGQSAIEVFKNIEKKHNQS